MGTALFGTDGIRGPAGQYPLDVAGATQIGKAIAAHFTKPGELVLVGRDPRESSPMLSEALIKGLLAMGVKVEDVGILPTPGLAYLTQQRGAQAGVMITASHNPYTDNGIKVFNADGGKLVDGIEDSLNALINSDISDRGTGSCRMIPEASADYETFLTAAADGASFEGQTIALDCANGAASGIAARVFQQLGADVTPLYDQPDGKNINVDCGATNTAALCDVVTQRKLSCGVALDGDADRVMLIDDRGRELTGDHILYILAVSGQQPGVVATLMSNMGLESSLKKHDIVLHRTAVGDRYVLEGLAKTGLKLGGEQSGHIILNSYTSTGDGLLAAIRTLVEVQNSGKSLAQWYDELVLLPQALVNIPLPDKSLLHHPDVAALVTTLSAQLGGQGRINIRPSGTEPKLRIMVESADAADRAQGFAVQLSELLASLTGPAAV